MSANYFDQVVTALDAHPTTADNPWELQQMYALLVLVRGTRVTLRDVHDAWAAWRDTTKPDHPDLVPFDALDADAQAKDEPYRRAIADVARARARTRDGAQ